MRNKILAAAIAVLIGIPALAKTPQRNKKQYSAEDERKKQEVAKILGDAWSKVKKGETADKSLENLQNFQAKIREIANKGALATESEMMWVLNPEYPHVKEAYFKDLRADFKAGKITQSQVNQIYRKYYGVYKKTRTKAVKSMEAFRRTVEGMTGLQYERRQKKTYFQQPFGSALRSIEKDLEENGMEPMTKEQKKELFDEFSSTQNDVKEADAATEAIDILNEQFKDCPGCVNKSGQ